MPSLTKEENEILLSIIFQCYDGIVTDEKYQSIMNQLKLLIPFDYWGIVYGSFDGEIAHMNQISWFKEIEGFEEFYIGKKLFYIDPIAQESLKQVRSEKPEVQFWMDTFLKYPESEFFKLISDFPIIEYQGYTSLYRTNLLQSVSLSITGPRLQPIKDHKIVRLLETIIPHVSNIIINGKIGKLKNLTDKQFRLYQLLKTSLSNKQIAKILNITPSGVEKSFEGIKKKIGVNNKKDLAFGFEHF